MPADSICGEERPLFMHIVGTMQPGCRRAMDRWISAL